MKKSEIIEKKVAEREHMMQMLYQMNMLGDFSQEAFDSFLQMQMTEAGVTGYSRQLYEAFALHREEIDTEIEKNSIK